MVPILFALLVLNLMLRFLFFYDYRSRHLGMDITMIGKTTYLIEGVAEGLTLIEILTFKYSGIRGNGMGCSIIICPNDSITNMDGLCW